jgi:hypothetical protein
MQCFGVMLQDGILLKSCFMLKFCAVNSRVLNPVFHGKSVVQEPNILAFRKGLLRRLCIAIADMLCYNASLDELIDASAWIFKENRMQC